MILVFLCLILVFVTLVALSKLEINIKDFDVQSFNKQDNNNKLLITISLKIFEFHWLKIKIDKRKLSNIYLKIKMQNQNIKINEIFLKVFRNTKENRKLKKEFRKIDFNAKKLNLSILLGTEDAPLTAYIVGGISIIISNILPHVSNFNEYKNYYYKIEPIYINKNIYKINLNCIFDAKLVHIIYVIFKLIKEEKYERTSNRKSYEYSYE